MDGSIAVNVDFWEAKRISAAEFGVKGLGSEKALSWGWSGRKDEGTSEVFEVENEAHFCFGGVVAVFHARGKKGLVGRWEGDGLFEGVFEGLLRDWAWAKEGGWIGK